jgi:DNA-binding GntR family transcriptional regulator
MKRSPGPARSRPKPRPTPKQLAYQKLRDAIVFSELAPGTPVNERDLARRYGVSRTPLREILVKLAHQHLVVIEPSKGAFVAPIDHAVARSLYEVRLPLERTTAALAAHRARPQDANELAALVERLEWLRARGDIARFIETDRRFHDHLARMAGNAILHELLEDLHNSSLRFWYANRETVYDGVLDVENLGRVAKAVACHDGVAAANAMGDHIMTYIEAAENYHRRSVDLLDEVSHGAVEVAVRR